MMTMKEVIARWFAWLQQATSREDEQLSHVYSDGRQLWASDGYLLHALDVALEKTGRVSVDDEGLFTVEETEAIPPFAATVPQSDPVATIVVSAEALGKAAAGKEGFVRLTLRGERDVLELSSAGKYALIMPALGADDASFWRPES